MTRPAYWQNCNANCERVADCVTCGKRKAPTGRDPGAYAANSYCAYECPGHWIEPNSGHLWPGELAEMDAPREVEE